MSRQPALFVSHGAPTFAVEPGRAGALLRAVGERRPRPAAVLVVSPHWMTRGLAVGAARRPATIHDFGGFDPALYTLRYPAPGDPALAAKLARTLRPAGLDVALDETRGLDHGAWVPLMHLFPAADLPVVQLSLPAAIDAAGAWRLGELLAPLRDEGVMIAGSGSLTHNLYEIGHPDDAEAAYARDFVAWVRRALLAGDRAALLDWQSTAPQARRAHPTPEHFLPLLIAAGAGGIGPGAVEVLDGGTRYGVLSMESYVFAAPTPMENPQ